MRIKIPAVYMRGGTSKAVFFHRHHLPKDPEIRDRIIQAAYGSPDPYGGQIDGMGGAVSTTSKVAIISPSRNPEYDVDYYFGQVSIDKPQITYKGNCGNISSAVGPFAIEEGLVKAETPITRVRIYQVNTDKLIIADLPVRDGLYEEDGDYAIEGVPGTGGEITLRFVDPGGSITKKLLPTGNTEDVLNIMQVGSVRISIVDAGNPVVFVRASDLGLIGKEIEEINQSEIIKGKLEEIRSWGAVLIGLAPDPEKAIDVSQDVPKIALVSPPQDYQTISGQIIHNTDIDLVVRMMSMGVLHRSCAVTGAVCTAGAARIDGTIVNELLSKNSLEKEEIRLGHPGGIMPVMATISKREGDYEYREAVVHRTARRLMDGYVYVRKTDYDPGS
ncbi:MAG: PrpF domain-containing protein [Anaerolineales bacterium]|jgi:hypothetical protein